MKGERVIAERDRLAETFKAAGAQFAFLFGSALDRDVPVPARDLDVAVCFARYSFAEYLALRERLSEVLKVREDDLDLVVLDRTNPRLRLEALLKGVPLFVADARSLDEFAVESLFAYEDYRRFKREYLTQWTKRVEEGLSMAEREMDRERVEGYLSKMDEAVARLTALRKRCPSVEEFERDIDTRELCVHHLRIALESVLDVCRHFLAVKGVSLLELDTTNLIELAGEKGLMEPGFAQKIRGMAGMRNAIVHVYWRLDYRAIYEVMMQRVEEFDEFARQVKGHLER